MIRHGCCAGKAALLTALIGLVGAAPAMAATTVGQVRPPADSGADCATNGGFVQDTVESRTPDYMAPSDGVLTSWSTNAGPDSGQSLKLKILRLKAGTTYDVVADSGFETVTPDALNSFPARIPVRAGDQIALKTGVSGTVQCLYDTASSSDASSDDASGPDSPAGGTMSFANGPTTQTRLNVAATLEADADHDNFGDETQDSCWTDPSTQATCPTPTVTGNVEVGATLTATPNGAPLSPTYAWLRCDPDGGTCEPIPGATGIKYQVTTSDEGHRLRFRKTATNAGGSQATDSAPTTLLPEPAQLLGASVSHRTFREAHSPHLVIMARRRPPVGTTITYTLDKGATARIAFTQAAEGRRVNGRCVAPARRYRHKRRCTRLVIRGSLTVPGHAGQNSVRFFGWLSSLNRLPPGHYMLVVKAITPGVGSSSSPPIRLTVAR